MYFHLAVAVAHTFDPALGRQRQVDLCEFEASLVFVKGQTRLGYLMRTYQRERKKERERERK